jgi:cell division protein FtsI (penicillin-binding protein 3)
LFTLGIVAVCSILFLRLVWLQIVKSSSYRKKAASQYQTKVMLPSHRGVIYDRNGRPLTENLGDWVQLGINPSYIADPRRFARDLSNVTGKAAKLYLERLNYRKDYVVLARQVSPQQADRLKKMGWNLHTESEIHRVYPQGALAGQLIGFTDIDNRGISGLEQSFDGALRGKEGWRVFQLDVEGKRHLDEDLPFQPQEDGGDLVTTIDLAIQSILEEELAPALDYYHAKSAAGLVMDPTTGEILAMASAPGFNPNSPDKFGREKQKNLPITEMFEPGSSFKAIGASLVLDKKIAGPEDEVDCGNGHIVIYDKTIHDAHPYNRLTFEDVIVKSSNIGMIRLTRELKPAELYRRICDFGFLGRTGIELSGEATGSLPGVENWSGLTQPNVVIGQGVSVTMVQLAAAYAAVANDGVLMRPTLVRGVRNSDGEVEKQKPLAVRRVISAKTARTLNRFLSGVVERGTARSAAIKGMPIAGKTGTSQIVNPETRTYFQDRFIAIFVGYFPANDPRYLSLICVYDPHGEKGEHMGGNVSAPIFHNVAARILGLKPELWNMAKGVERPEDDQLVEVPDVTFLAADAATGRLKEAGLSILKSGNGSVIYDQAPRAGSLVNKKSQVQVTLGPKDRSRGPAAVMPVLVGLSLRDAVMKATECGLAVKVNGSGRVVKQSPGSGARVETGDLCMINGE